MHRLARKWLESSPELPQQLLRFSRSRRERSNWHENRFRREMRKPLPVSRINLIAEQELTNRKIDLADHSPAPALTAVKHAFQTRGVPQPAIDIIIASLAPSTISQYSSPLRFWWNYVHLHHCSLFAPKTEDVLYFLSDLLQTVGSYSALNVARSAILLISTNAIGVVVNLSLDVCKGVSVLKPSRSRYDYIWDPSPIVAKLAALFPHESLSLETLTKKLVLLLALASGQRCHTLAAICVSQVLISAERAFICIPDHLKTSASGRSQPLLSFPCLEGHRNLCIVTLLSDYISRTRDIRPSACDSVYRTQTSTHSSGIPDDQSLD
ncbi:LOW QUALITY PROTEIN: uncharacterized protein [Mycetomoellerius zeteki]|uniref:LOW QUALITY PROTEIN: uncharacterized protein n=1 Tax=Mycetomoellerius zeteki TaxID=64791 RepID=UPI00084EA47C|nr:PREDICTED: LOW QUALITY PROTEIN: uncharacterized protein LOC108725685 [Trachymyrmex zeteki]